MEGKWQRKSWQTLQMVSLGEDRPDLLCFSWNIFERITQFQNWIFFKFTFGDDRTAQRSQSHGILPEPPWQVVHRHFSLQLQGSRHPLLASWGYLRTHSIGTQRRIHGHINKNKSLRNWLCTRFLKACMLSSSQARLATDTDCLEAADFLGAR